MIELNSVRRKHALEGDEMLGVAIHQRPVEIEQKRGFHERLGYSDSRHHFETRRSSHRRSDLPGRELRVAIS